MQIAFSGAKVISRYRGKQMNLFEEVQDIAALAKKIQRSDEEREEMSYEDEARTNEVCKLGPPRRKSGELKRNKIYTERELAIHFDNKDR